MKEHDNVSHLYVDAAFSPTTRKAGWAANFAYKSDGLEKRRIFYSSLNPPYRTHNCAETLAAIYAIHIILSSNVALKRLNVHLDSHYAIRFLYKHYKGILYFPGSVVFSESFTKNPHLSLFYIEDYYDSLIKQLQNKLITSKVDIGIFHVKSHVERHPINPRNRHHDNNNKTDFYAKVAREAAERGHPIKLSILNEGNHVLRKTVD